MPDRYGKMVVVGNPHKIGRRMMAHCVCDYRGNNKVIEIDGVKKTLGEWAIESPVTYQGIRYRIQNGWDPKDAVFLPSKTKRIGS